MERELYARLYRMVYSLGRSRRGKHVVYPNHVIVMVWFWAVMHNRPVCWACRVENWPTRTPWRSLPSASTLSRRLRRPDILSLIKAVEKTLVQRGLLRQMDTTMFVDAKPLPVGGATKDPDAKCGYATAGLANGYKLHAVCTSDRTLIAWVIKPMNEREPTVAPELVDQLAGRGYLVGDGAYDSNPLYEYAGQRGWQVVAPRRPNTKLGKIRHSRFRLYAHLEMDPQHRDALLLQRTEIERCFAHLTCSSVGLSPLPHWVRRLYRVRRWVHAKIILYLVKKELQHAA